MRVGLTAHWWRGSVPDRSDRACPRARGQVRLLRAERADPVRQRPRPGHRQLVQGNPDGTGVSQYTVFWPARVMEPAWGRSGMMEAWVTAAGQPDTEIYVSGDGFAPHISPTVTRLGTTGTLPGRRTRRRSRSRADRISTPATRRCQPPREGRRRTSPITRRSTSSRHGLQTERRSPSSPIAMRPIPILAAAPADERST